MGEVIQFPKSESTKPFKVGDILVFKGEFVSSGSGKINKQSCDNASFEVVEVEGSQVRIKVTEE